MLSGRFLQKTLDRNEFQRVPKRRFTVEGKFILVEENVNREMNLQLTDKFSEVATHYCIDNF
jgi:hypothetical protein